MRLLNLWLDDERPEPEGWLRVTTGENAIAVLRQLSGLVHTLSLDHDLDDHIDTRRGYSEPGPLTGYDVAAWLEARAHEGDWSIVPTRILCHSMNPGGRDRIVACVRSMQVAREVWEAERRSGRG